MSTRDTAGGIRAVASGIGGFSSGYLQGRRLRLDEEREDRREAREDEYNNWRKTREKRYMAQLEEEKLDRARKRKEYEKQQALTKYTDAYQMASMQDKRGALARINEGVPEDSQIADMFIQPDTRDWILIDRKAKSTRIPFEQIAWNIPKYRALVNAHYGGGANTPKLGDYETGMALADINRYYNVDPQSIDNPNGISATARRAVEDALTRGIPDQQRGISYRQIGSSLGLSPRGPEAVDAAKAALDRAQIELDLAKQKATRNVLGFGKGISDKEALAIQKAEKDVAEKKQAYQEAIELNNTDLDSMRFGIGATGRMRGMGSMGQSPQTVRPGPGGGLGAGSLGAPAELPTVQELDDNQDGRLDEQDKKVKAALWAEKNPELIEDPRDIEEAKAILKVYRSQLDRKAKKVLAGPAFFFR